MLRNGRKFKTISEDFHDDVVCDALVAREREIHAYEMNIESYEDMLGRLPQEDPPPRVARFLKAKVEDVPDDAFEQVQMYKMRERFRLLLRTEKVELAKSQMAYECLCERLPKKGLDEKLSRAVARMSRTDENRLT